jgi:adenylate cyclase
MASSKLGRLQGLAQLAQAIAQAQDMDELFQRTLDELQRGFGLDHVFILLHEPARERLFTVASRGYEQSGVGAEVKVGVGTIGVVARSRRPLLSGNLRMELGYARTVRQQAARAGQELGPEIPLPGLTSPGSQLVVPLVTNGMLVGVACAESPEIGAFDEELEAVLVTGGALLAAALEHARLRGVHDADEPTSSRPKTLKQGPRLLARHYVEDDSVFVNDAYIIKGLAGRILFKVLAAYRDEGRTQFGNRQLRLDPELELSPLRDNLESRLLMLRRRLEDKACGIAIASTGRGRFELSVDGELALESITARQ